MQHVVVEDLRESFRVAERRRGTWGALAGLVARRHRVVHAIDGVSFRLDEGELVGYIGPNGAGKSTTVKVLSGILVPDGGRVEVLGRVPWRERIEHVRRISVVFGQRTQLWWDLPVVESCELLRSRVTSERELVVDLRDEAAGAAVADPDAIEVRQDGPRARIRFDPQRVATPDLIARLTARYPVADLVVESPPIEEIVARRYKEMDA